MKFCIATSCSRTHTNLCNSNQYYCHYTIMYSSSLWLSAQNHSHFDALLSGFNKPAYIFFTFYTFQLCIGANIMYQLFSSAREMFSFKYKTKRTVCQSLCIILDFSQVDSGQVGDFQDYLLLLGQVYWVQLSYNSYSCFIHVIIP